jgi:arylsulfatase A-like enzyme
MMTGLYPSAHGARFFSNFRFFKTGLSVRLADHHVTLAETLRSAGYRTAARTSVRWLGNGFGVMQGFDLLEAKSPDVSAALSVDRILEWFLEGGDQPRFFFLHVFDVHQYRSPASYETRFVDSSYRGKLHGRVTSIIANTYDHLSDTDVSYAVAKYDAALAFVDAELGRLFDELRKAGLFEETLIIVTSDHGEEFWDHGGTGHGFTLYEEQLRVPLIVKPPAAFPVRNGEPDVPAGVIDIVPTVLHYLGLSAPKDRFQGESLRPHIEKDVQPRTRPLFAEDTYFFNSYAVVLDEEKYIHNRIPPYDLFNPGLLLSNLRAFYKFRAPDFYRLVEDPAEKRNLAGASAETDRGLVEAILGHLEGSEAPDPFRVDEDVAEELRSLGYIH